jgi:class 3 adenylate cyclase
VKTLGDRTMAVFRRPIAAVRCGLQAQRALASPVNPLRLKVGIHSGPSIAVTLNDKLDYFGVTVNLAARLSGLSMGDDLVASGAVLNDPEVESWLADEGIPPESMAAMRGYEREAAQLFRLRSRR